MADIQTLEKVYRALPQHDHDFALSLISQGSRRTLSEKQQAWVERLIAKAKNVAPVQKTEEKVELSGINGLFDKARQHLKFPAIVLATDDALLRLKPAGSSSRYPGTINIVRETDREWLGRIHLDGRFEPSRRAGTDPKAVVPHLQKFARDPMTGAKESAKLTGKCVFCNTKITDERSTNVGYGKICAARYGLPY